MDKFIVEVSKFNFLITSIEFKAFARQRGMVERYFEAMVRQKPSEILEKYKKVFNVEGA